MEGQADRLLTLVSGEDSAGEGLITGRLTTTREGDDEEDGSDEGDEEEGWSEEDGEAALVAAIEWEDDVTAAFVDTGVDESALSAAAVGGGWDCVVAVLWLDCCCCSLASGWLLLLLLLLLLSPLG